MDSDKSENIKKIIKFGIQFYISLKLFSIGTDFIGTFLRTIDMLTEKSALIPILSDVLLLLIILAFYLLYKYMKKKNTDEWYNNKKTVSFAQQCTIDTVLFCITNTMAMKCKILAILIHRCQIVWKCLFCGLL